MHKQVLFDLNQTYIEENLESISEDEITMDDGFKSTKEVCDKPFVGQSFPTEEEAFAFYQNFAKLNGFSIRKGRFSNKNGEKSRRDFFCHRQGRPDVKLVDPSKEQRNRSSARCECKAQMRITLKKANEIFPEEWHVINLILEHNHELLSTEEVHFLPSYRSITKDDEKHILMFKECGLSVRQIMRVMELEKNVPHGKLSFLTKDIHNFLAKIRQTHSQNDAKELLEFCKQSKSQHPNFQYVYTLDHERKLEHIFWSNSQCFDWYQKYGDVVVFDTTYKVNSYDMPFGIFVGVDNHGRTILFGCALLRNETTDTFQWLLKNFVLLMMHAPKTILTDQDLCITKAIENEMPFTKHAFCIWHITAKFSSWFISILKSDYSSWCSEFYSLYILETIEEFEQQWSFVIKKFNLEGNKHVNGLYQIRRFWVPTFLRGFFFGGMTTTGRSESINAFIKKYISRKTCLTQFIRQIDLAIEDVGQKQLHNTMLEKYRGYHMRTQSPLEEQGHRFLTPYAFKKFQGEFELALQYMVHEETYTNFIVSHHKAKQDKKHKVVWDGNVAMCSCKNFEFVGILCRHILSVLIHKDCFKIPLTYWASRWRRTEASASHDISLVGSTSTRNSELMNDVIAMVQCPPTSKTKGRPKETRTRGGMEYGKKRRRCKLCRVVGHNINTCSEREKLDKVNASFVCDTKKAKNTLEHQDLNPVLSMKY